VKLCSIVEEFPHWSSTVNVNEYDPFTNDPEAENPDPDNPVENAQVTSKSSCEVKS